MKTLLAIGVSPRYEYSTSRKLTSLFVQKWQAAHPGGQVIDRDLLKTNLPFVDLPWIGGAFAPPEQHSPESAAAIKISNDLVAD
jgi:FMN-dependent NADH-azoreductase